MCVTSRTGPSTPHHRHCSRLYAIWLAGKGEDLQGDPACHIIKMAESFSA